MPRVSGLGGHERIRAVNERNGLSLARKMFIHTAKARVAIAGSTHQEEPASSSEEHRPSVERMEGSRWEGRVRRSKSAAPCRDRRRKGGGGKLAKADGWGKQAAYNPLVSHPDARGKQPHRPACSLTAASLSLPSKSLLK
eukprot:scaffold62004_cov30-Tisochrysis_lutea.AAC.4